MTLKRTPFHFLSEDTLAQHLKRAYAGQKADVNRFKPNPLGPGYLTRNERWNEVIRTYEREFMDRCLTRAARAIAGVDQ